MEKNKSDQKRKNIDVSSGSVTGSINVGGNVRQVTRDVSVNTGAGTFIGGNVNVAGGDFVGRDKASTISEEEMALLFRTIVAKIDTISNLDEFDRSDLREEVQKIAEELHHNGAFADEAFLFRRMRNIKRLCPDISQLIFQTFTSPTTGFNRTFGRIAEMME